MNWASVYIGIPYKIEGRDSKGLDCWGLFKLVFAERHDITIPNNPHNLEIKNWKVIKIPSDGDAVLMKSAMDIIHVGIVVKLKTKLYILHAIENSGVILSNLTEITLLNFKIKGYYRHVKID